MLVENKFLFLSLPRRASTAFMTTCIFNQLEVECYDDDRTNIIKFLYEDGVDDINIVRKKRLNRHVPINLLYDKFSKKYPVIAIKRNPYERFISHYNHCLDSLSILNEFEVLDKIKELKIDEILFFKKEDLILNDDTLRKLAKEFTEKNEIFDLFKNKYARLEWIDTFRTIYIPDFVYTNYETNIIWFDFKKLYELENWVSNILNKEFKLMRINEASVKNPNYLTIDENFIKKYDEYYKEWDNPKNIKTLI